MLKMVVCCVFVDGCTFKQLHLHAIRLIQFCILFCQSQTLNLWTVLHSCNNEVSPIITCISNLTANLPTMLKLLSKSSLLDFNLKDKQNKRLHISCSSHYMPVYNRGYLYIKIYHEYLTHPQSSAVAEQHTLLCIK